jgi:peptidyl-prolyl cis-trans isomerase SurA
MMRRLLALLFLVTAAAGPLAAQLVPPKSSVKLGQQAPPRPVGDLPVDRIVAIVGQRPITWGEVLEQVYTQSRGRDLPTDSASQINYARDVLNGMIDTEVLIAAAKQYKIEVPDAEVQPQVDKRMKEIRGQFKTDQEFRDVLKKESFGTESELRRFQVDQFKRELLQQRAIDSLKAHGRMSAPVGVTEAEVSESFERSRDRLPKRPTTVSFRQIVVPPKANAAERKAALDKISAIAIELSKKGADFEQIAKRESQDPASKETGGDLGWNRRGTMVPEFDQMMFRLAPGAVSPIVETVFGFHLIKVDRIQPAEVKARHILIVPDIDSADVALARVRADSVLRLWKGGTPYDTLLARYHDNSELKSFPDGYVVDSLPAEYQKAMAGVKSGQFTQPFEIPNPRTGKPKFVIIQVTERVEGGEYTVADMRDRIRSQLQQEKGIRRVLDALRREQFVSIRL